MAKKKELKKKIIEQQLKISELELEVRILQQQLEEARKSSTTYILPPPENPWIKPVPSDWHDWYSPNTGDPPWENLMTICFVE